MTTARERSIHLESWGRFALEICYAHSIVRHEILIPPFFLSYLLIVVRLSVKSSIMEGIFPTEENRNPDFLFLSNYADEVIFVTIECYFNVTGY